MQMNTMTRGVGDTRNKRGQVGGSSIVEEIYALLPLSIHCILSKCHDYTMCPNNDPL